MRNQPSDRRRTARDGFTLIEMLVVIGILVIVMTMTLVLVNQTTQDDKISGASRIVQSMLEGARSRALQAKEPRGVRFLRNDSDDGFVTSMVYVGAPGKYDVGQIVIVDDNQNRPRRIVFTGNANWNKLRLRDLLDNDDDGDGLYESARIRIAGQLPFYSVRYDSTVARWVLTRDFKGGVSASGMDYELDLLPTILPNEEPRELPKGVVIQLEHSLVPLSWTDRLRMDIVFSPRGTIVGTPASTGHIHLLITGLGDATAAPDGGTPLYPGDPDKEDAETIVTVTTQTGAVSTHSVAVTTDPFDPATNDKFKYAETGVVTK